MFNKEERKMKKHFVMVTAICVLMALLVSGCQTTGQSAVLGGLLGAAAGGIIGNQSGHALEGALIGAALGGLTGAIIGNERQKRLATKEEVENAYFQETGEMVTEPKILLDSLAIAPQYARPGETVTASCVYSVMGPETSPREGHLIFMKDNNILHQQKMKKKIEDGKIEYTCDVNLPGDLEDGNYDLVMEVVNGPAVDRKSQIVTVAA